jgi:hypothetical protein
MAHQYVYELSLFTCTYKDARNRAEEICLGMLSTGITTPSFSRLSCRTSTRCINFCRTTPAGLSIHSGFHGSWELLPHGDLVLQFQCAAKPPLHTVIMSTIRPGRAEWYGHPSGRDTVDIHMTLKHTFTHKLYSMPMVHAIADAPVAAMHEHHATTADDDEFVFV